MIDLRRGSIDIRNHRTDRSRNLLSRKASKPSIERLDARLVLTTTLASTTVAGMSIGQTLANVINNASLGGLTVDDTTGFLTTTPPNFLLLSQNGAPFASVSYIGIDSAASSFTTLAMPAGDGTVVLTSETVVAQAPRGTTAAGAGQPLSANPFSLTMSGAADGFSSTGYIYVQASRGTYIMNYTGLTTNGSGDAQFTGCTIAGAFGSITGSPYTDTVNAGSFIVQTVAPPRGQTVSVNASEITVIGGVAFDLPIISRAGFSPATANDPKFTLLYYANGDMALVSYTGISVNPAGGFLLNGCATQTAGTIGTYGSTSGPSSNVQWTSAAPIDFAFTNNSGQVPVYVAIAGQQIDPTTGTKSFGYLAPQMNGSTPDLTKTWQFQTYGGLTDVPYYTIFSTSSEVGDKQSLLIPNNPFSRLDSIRMIFSVGSPPTIPIISGQPSFPAAGNPSDPNDDTTYDFVEFTQRSSPNDGILFINTTQVDQVGIPFTMQTTPPDSVKSNGVGITVSRSEMFTQFESYIQTQFGPLTGTTAANAASAFVSLTTPNRLLNPSDSITNPPAASVPATFGTYFDAALTRFFNAYVGTGNTFRFQRDGYFFSGQTVTDYNPAPYVSTATNNGSALLIPPVGNGPSPLVFSIGQPVSGPGVPSGATITGISVDSTNVTTLSYSPAGTAQSTSETYSFSVPGGYTVLQLSQTDSNWTPLAGGQQYQIYAPYFSNGTPYPTGFPASSTTPPAAPPWIAPASAGLMVFGNLGAFADGAFQAATGQISGSGATGQTLLDIQNSIVSAFNRGIANAVAPGNDVTAAWNENTSFYPTPSQNGSNWSNFYAGFLHNDNVSVTAPGSTIGLAYGFAYDDQGGNDPTLTSFAARVAITLGLWTTATDLGIEPAHLTTVVGTPTQVTITAYRDKSDTKVATDYVGKIEFGAAAVAAGLPSSYQFRPGDSGTKVFTFTPKTAGEVTVIVTDPANRLSTSTNFAVEPGRISFAVGSDEGSAAIVKAFDSESRELVEIMPYGASFRGGVRVAVGDVNGDGYADIITVPGPGLNTEVRVFDGRNGERIANQTLFGPNFTGGSYVATGDLDGDGRHEVIVGSGAGIAAQLWVINGASGQPIAQRAPFHAGFRGGVTVAAADLNGDGRDEIVVGAGSGSGGHVRVFDGLNLHVRSTFRAFGHGFGGSVFVAAGDLLGNGEAEIIAGASPTRPSHAMGSLVRVFRGNGRSLAKFRSTMRSDGQGPRIAAFPAEGHAKLSILINGGPGFAEAESYRMVNVSQRPGRTSFRAFLARTIRPFGVDHASGFYVAGRGVKVSD